MYQRYLKLKCASVPSHRQVVNMLECAKELREKSSRLTNREYFHSTSHKKRVHEILRNPRRPHRNNGEKKKLPRKMSSAYTRKTAVPERFQIRDVFLGGSCNPTTWRQDVAIPLLESNDISYYNPQVANWTADLVEVEHNAKESAKILFYVLDRRTRNVASIVEAANFAGSRRNLVLVLDEYDKQELVAGESISHTEFEELCSGLATLSDIAKQCGIPVFHNIPTAINWTAKVLLSEKFQDFGFRPNSVKRTQKFKDLFEILDVNRKGEIDINDIYLAYQILTTKKTSARNTNGLLALRRKSNGEDEKINFDQFCSMMKNIKDESTPQSGINEKMLFCCSPITRNNIEEVTSLRNDIYVGGSCYDVTWKENEALPILRKSSLKYHLNECPQRKCSRACSKEMTLMENSRVLVFVITANTRGLETMALAAYYIGKKKKLVLCVQNITENTTLFNEDLTITAMNDYNRGRVYLKDLALRQRAHVVDSVSEAVQYAVNLCGGQQQSSSR